MKPDLFSLYVVTDPILIGTRSLETICEEVFGSGVKMLQLRDKHSSTRELIAQARSLRQLANQFGGCLLVNDRVDIALAAQAHGVHLGQDDMMLADARRLLGPEAIIGISARTQDQAQAAEIGGADYVAANLVFATPTKTDLDSPLGLDGIRSLRAATRLPLVAIGGIHAGNATSVIKAGADGVAVVSAVMAAADAGAACRQLLEAVSRGRKARDGTHE